MNLYIYMCICQYLSYKSKINTHVSAMDYFTFFLFGHCWILPTKNLSAKKYRSPGQIKMQLEA